MKGKIRSDEMVEVSAEDVVCQLSTEQLALCIVLWAEQTLAANDGSTNDPLTNLQALGKALAFTASARGHVAQ